MDVEGGLCLIDFGLGYVGEFLFKEILSAYQAEIKDNKVKAEIIRKYEEIRMRGRTREMVPYMQQW